MHQLKFLLYTSLLILLFSTNHAHTAIPIFTHYGTEQGLSTTNVRAITQDQTGYMWVGTRKGLFKFDGYQFTKETLITNDKDIQVNHLLTDHLGRIWVGTQKNGLFKWHNGNWQQVSFSPNDIVVPIQTITQATNHSIWVGTSSGLNHYDEANNALVKHNVLNHSIFSIINASNQDLWIGSIGQIHRYNINNGTINTYQLANTPNAWIHDILEKDKQLWLATSKGLVLFDLLSKQFINGPSIIPDTRILTIEEHKNDLWIATIDQGLFHIEQTKKITNYRHSQYKHSLSDQYIMTLFISNDNHLWIGNFYKGLNQLLLDSLAFKYENAEPQSLSCADSAITYQVLETSQNNLLISTSKGLIQYNTQTQYCHLKTTDYIIYSINKNKDNLWLATSDGLKSYLPENNSIAHLNYQGVVFFTFQDSDGLSYIGTKVGLFEYFDDQISPKIVKGSEQIEFTYYQQDSTGKIYFLTNNGIKVLYQGQLNSFEFFDKKYNSPKFTALHISPNNDIYLASEQKVLTFNTEGQSVDIHDITNANLMDFKINSLLADRSQQSLWMGTDKGLIHYDVNNRTSTLIKNITSQQATGFLPQSSYQSSNHMFFGTTNGFIHFDPSHVAIKNKEQNVIINAMKLLNKPVKVNQSYPSGFKINKPINQLSEITLTHKDYIVDFEFTTLDYEQPNHRQYAHRLVGLNEDWFINDAKHRQATYTNLNPGHYKFEVKTTNNFGQWSSPKQLKIQVLPAPWLTWWAFTAYALTIFGLIYWYWQKKNRDNIRITKMLRTQVKQRTQELEVQKQKVEKLLAKKNEMFANVSHEFRTPLTLILGPINKLLKTPRHEEEMQSLRMVNRNANRLLTMIEQLLLLAKLTGAEKITHIPQLIHHQVLSIFEIFNRLALEKGIEMSLVNNNEAAINATENTIDTVLGNLLSNAIKYTPTGGKVTVKSYTSQDQVLIEVSDTGCGLDDHQKKEIFNRFQRLDAHSNIDGVGIGLSIVEEILKINNGTLSIDSEPGRGTTFIVAFDSIETTNINHQHNQHNLVNQLAKNALLETNYDPLMISPKHEKKRDTILIIEDNDDMRHHIAQSIDDHFNPLLADRGKSGIALAIKHVPDIIICDVMMPEMDGFKVSRILRSDSRTSHIPLILLTALHNKESRIQGWREHVDAYLTKPFDADELLLQLNNVLVIRNILKKKTSHIVQAGKKTPENIDLPKKDKEFVDKVNAIIAKNYCNPVYQRKHLAKSMAVSEKQLQRKLKALIDKNPMELLREFRLSMATEKLKEGHQVSIVCDECGFNSLSHFSQCFKAHYGVSPKAYQQTCNKKM